MALKLELPFQRHLIPSVHIEWELTPIGNSSSSESDALLWPPHAPTHTCVCVCVVCRHVYVHVFLYMYIHMYIYIRTSFLRQGFSV